MADQLGRQLGDLKLSTTEKLAPDASGPGTGQKSSSIFLTKKFNSLSSKKKPLSQKDRLGAPTNNQFDKGAFFNDAPMAVDDKRWNEKQTFAIGKPIQNPMAQNDRIDPRKDVLFVTGGLNFQKFAKEDSPFKDPYSILNKSGTHRAGASFLDSPSKFGKEQEAANGLIHSISASDDAKELEKLKNEKITDEDRKVKGISVNLLDHQVHGLKFLRKREKKDVLKKGGLLCDDMGLGKTIQAIALIVKNGPKEDKDIEYCEFSEDDESSEDEENKKANNAVPLRNFRATLVVCPVSLTSQWIAEVKRFAPHLRTKLFHGPRRATSYGELLRADVVVTSYDTLRAEFISRPYSSPMYEGYWHRIVLDEAHVIKNSASKTALATFRLESPRRWCLTGTPVQNSVDDLQSLFQFLRISDLANPEIWKAAVTKAIRSYKSDEAFNMVKKELDVLMLRRTKAILKSVNFRLPEKRIHKVEIKFSEMEQQIYDHLSANFTSKLKWGSLKEDNEEKKGTENKLSQTGNIYMSALAYLLRLRQLCCHWKLISHIHSQLTPKLENSDEKNLSLSPSKKVVSIDRIDQELDDLTSIMGSLTVKDLKCEVCLVEDATPEEKRCKACDDRIRKNEKTESAKVLKLIEILQKDRTRKTIVFSQFRELLLLVGPVLQNYGIKFVMYDGQMNLKQKDAALETLRTDEDVTVLLCSLKSGAVGLNLTVASQVVMFDPWWNPQIQEQAVDRVYRIGQTREVDIHVFAVAGTVEVGILELQETKKQLAKAVTDDDGTSKAALTRLSTGELMKLFGI